MAPKKTEQNRSPDLLREAISNLKNNRLVKATGYLLGFALFWSLDFILTTSGLIKGLEPLQLVVLRSVVASVFLLVFLVDDQFLKIKLPPAGWALFVLTGLAGVTLTPLFLTLNRYAHAPPATDIVFLLNLAPLFLLLLALLFLKEKITASKLCGSLVATAGMVLILANWERPSTFAPFARYQIEELFVLAAALSWAFFTVLAKKLLHRTGFENTTALIVLLGTAPLLVAGLATKGLALFVVSSDQWLAVLSLGLFSSAYAYLFWFKALDFWESSSAGSILFLAPLMLTLFILVEKIFLPFMPSPLVVGPVICGSSLILAGVGLNLFLHPFQQREYRSTTPSLLRKRVRLSSKITVFLICLALISLLAAGVAAFSPAKVSLIKGTLDAGTPYSKQWTTQGYQMAAAYLLLLAALVDLVLVWRLRSSFITLLEVLVWSGVSTLVLISFWFARATVLVNWLNWMPPEIQFAIGSPLVTLKETLVLNWSSVVSFSASLFFAALMLAWAFSQTQKTVARKGRRYKIHETTQKVASGLAPDVEKRPDLSGR